MVKKLALTSLYFSSNDKSLSPCSPPSMSASSSTAASWQWPSCTQARTLSFSRDDDRNTEISMHQFHFHHHHKQEEDYRASMMSPAYFLDSTEHSCLSSSSASTGVNMSESLSTASEPAAGDVVANKVDEAIIHGLRSNRLFFEPESTSSIVKATTAFDGATVMAIDSDDPYGDFRRSMEEMVMRHGVNDWGWLEEMLGWYLKANGKKTHGLIVGAFVDSLVALTSPPSPTCCSSSFMGLQVVKKGKQSDGC